MIEPGDADVDERSLARQEYDLQLHAAYLRACRAIVQGDRLRATLRGQASETADAALYVEAELEWVEQRLAELADDTDARPMLGLAERLRWSADEVGFLWTVVALAANPRLLVQARALDDSATRGVSLALYGQIASLPADAARDLGLAMTAGHAAIEDGLIVPSPGGGTPAAVPWTPSPALVRHLAGMAVRSRQVVEIQPPLEPILDADQERALARIAAVVGDAEPVVLYIEGAGLTGRRTAVALASPTPVLGLDLCQVGPSPNDLAEALAVLRRDATLRGAVPLFTGVEALATSDADRRVLARHIEDMNRPVVVVSTRGGLDVGARLPIERVAWPIPDIATRGRLWRAAIGGSRSDVAEADDAGYDPLAHGFRLGAGAIGRAVARTLASASPTEPLSSSLLLAGVRQSVAERMAGFAERVIVHDTWEDVVVPEHVAADVRSLIHAAEPPVGPHGSGIAALFTGPPGTGKTLVSGVVARSLDADLYQADLVRITASGSRKAMARLACIFDAASAGNIVLVLDEIGALFGCAIDRRVDLMTELLEHIGSFRGVVILTRSLDPQREHGLQDPWLDKALRQRVWTHVTFPAPNEDERAQLWERRLRAEGEPLDRGIDLRALAQQFPRMVGANIRHAARAARHLAVAAGHQHVTCTEVVQAARNEYLSMGHVPTSTSAPDSPRSL